jgi:hypothetical protein
MTSRNIVSEFEEEFRKTKAGCEKALSQIDDAGLHAQINADQNSPAIIIQHVGGNLVSRFTDFLTADGEKPNRDRENEFADRQLSRSELMEIWERGWNCLLSAVAPLTDEDLSKIVMIRNEPHSVHKALLRASTHLSWHAAQFALIGKHLKGADWKYLTIPPKRSTEFNRSKGM